MGLLLGPLVENIFVGKLDKCQLSQQIPVFKHYGRYFDDIFAIIPAEYGVNAFLNTAKQAHISIKCNLEVETTGALPFFHDLP
ncbi:unnamed protein product [Dibothriocephalus latus]|uniref:Reverse transcriptase domain-containing protein n=1 Tax=Dibothriocephalus latus TaxID=60516 RepID=A0A3P6TZH8_DIBLA|nr:unnamed protein product [Dibothriocephalus latus]